MVEPHVVPIEQEPRHRLVLQEGAVRVFDVRIPPGDTTLYHTHDSAILYVPVSISPTDSQILGGDWGGVKPTDPSRFRMDATDEITRYAARPVTHRVKNVGTRLFRLIAVTNARDPAAPSSAVPAAKLPGELERESPWFRASRLALSAGEVSEWCDAVLPTILIQPEAGTARVEREPPAGSAELRDAGSWIHLPPGTRYRIANLCASRTVLVVAEAR
jgi:quercetin dioxygenase-like cupin family protein